MAEITSIQAKDVKIGDIIVDSNSNDGNSYPVSKFRTVSGHIEIFCGKSLRRYIMRPQDGLCVRR